MPHPNTISEQQLIKLIKTELPEQAWPENAKYVLVRSGHHDKSMDLPVYEQQPPVSGVCGQPVKVLHITLDKPIHLEDVSVLTKKWLYMTQEIFDSFTIDRGEKYRRDLKGVRVDVYDVLNAFGVTCSASQHAIKKLLMAGGRGGKSRLKELQEAGVSVQRAVELEQENEKNVTAP